MMTQVMGSWATPTPMATIDSPSATMMIKPCAFREMSRRGQPPSSEATQGGPYVVGEQRKHP